MYAIVHKNKIILGPLEWSQKYFTNILKIRHRIEANVPGVPPKTLPYQINEDTAIHFVIVNMPEFDPMTQGIEGPFWDLTAPIIVANYGLLNQSIESARSNFEIIAANERYKKEVSGIKITIQGVEVTIDTSRDGRHIYFQKLFLMKENDTVRWKFPEQWLTISKQELAYIVEMGATHIQSVFNWESDVNDQIKTASNAKELYKVEIVEKSQ